MNEKMEMDKVAFGGPPGGDRGFKIRASYLKPPHDADALIEIFRDGKPLRCFTFPAYKIYNLQAHFHDIVDGEIEGHHGGYRMAAWDGITGAIVILPENQDSRLTSSRRSD